jgi:nitrogen-specific signal transduction histidine kinase
MQKNHTPLAPPEQFDRWVIIGRLTASLFHEINNPMQAIRGALSLSLEELDDPEALRDYLQLSLQESDKVVQLIERVRRIYYSPELATATFDLNHLLHECAALSRKYLSRRRVKLMPQLTPEPLPLTAVFSELSLAFLCVMMQLADEIGGVGGGEVVMVSTAVAPSCAQIQFTTSSIPLPADGFALSLCSQIIRQHQGHIKQYQKEQQAVIEIKLPLST